MPDKALTEIIDELKWYGVPPKKAIQLATELLQIGIAVAPWRAETREAVKQVENERVNGERERRRLHIVREE